MCVRVCVQPQALYQRFKGADTLYWLEERGGRNREKKKKENPPPFLRQRCLEGAGEAAAPVYRLRRDERPNAPLLARPSLPLPSRPFFPPPARFMLSRAFLSRTGWDEAFPSCPPPSAPESPAGPRRKMAAGVQPSGVRQEKVF